MVAACAAALLFPLQSAASASSKKPELMCIAAGFVPGTLDYDECLAVAKLNQQKNETIGNGLALDICDNHARKKIKYPVKKLQTSRVSGSFEKKVHISYSIDKSAEDPNITYSSVNMECILRGRELVDVAEVPY